MVIRAHGRRQVPLVIKGVAAALTAPAALSLIITTFAEGPQRNRALGPRSPTACCRWCSR
ncbi:hypothetical protein HD593_005714 [Nonomuraea rubra]|uniref:Uncharacterized protein n=1 Tax=Nonomuraea rubra TaxID=46180 RepID=A0A7X0U100_9ACTN|nr:hypothetical protein [Nonomuraea rubra]